MVARALPDWVGDRREGGGGPAAALERMRAVALRCARGSTARWEDLGPQDGKAASVMVRPAGSSG